jgi:hypothetical protein
VEGFAAVAFPLVRRVFGNLIANEIVSVQPMSLPSGLIFFLDFKYTDSKAMGGASAGGIAALSPKLKMDLSNLCRLTGKRLVITSGYRPNDNRYHGRRFAIDTALSPYSQEEQVIVVLYFMAHFYGGIGSYGNQPMHLDHRDHSMRWGPPSPYLLSYCKTQNYYPSVQKAFQLIGYPPCATPDYRAVAEKAKSVLKSLGKEQFAI